MLVPAQVHANLVKVSYVVCIRNAALTCDHQKEALHILTRCHPMLMDDMCTIFDLKTTPEKDQLALIKTLLTRGKMNEAVTYTWKLGLQKHFNTAEVRIPSHMYM